MARNNYSLGLLLIGIAVILLLGKLGLFSALGSFFWPLFIMVPGIAFHLLYFSRIWPVGVLIPGGILITYSLMFFYCNLFGWNSMSYLWPGFIFGVAVGLYEFYIFDSRNARGAFTAALILSIIAAVFFVFSFMFTVGVYFVAAALILIGIYLMMAHKRSW